MKKISGLLSVLVFVLAFSVALITHANQRSLEEKNKLNPVAWLAGQCNSPVSTDQALCAGGSKLCTVGGSAPVYSSAIDCRNGSNPLKFQ